MPFDVANSGDLDYTACSPFTQVVNSTIMLNTSNQGIVDARVYPNVVIAVGPQANASWQSQSFVIALFGNR